MNITNQICEARKNLIAMMRMQGFATEQFEDWSILEVNARFENDDLDMLFVREEGGGQREVGGGGEMMIESAVGGGKAKVLVKFLVKEKLNVKMVEELREEVFLLEPKLSAKNTEQDSSDVMLLVSRKDMNDTMKAHLRQAWNHDRTMVSVVSLARLQFNLLEHVLVPRHVVISLSEFERTVGRTQNVRKEELPDISRFDPVAVIAGMLPGQICRIERSSKTAIVANYYRKCINE